MLENLTVEQLRGILEVRHARAQVLVERAVEGGARARARVLEHFPHVLPLDSPFGATEGSLIDVPSLEIYSEIRGRQKALYGEDDRVEVADCLDAARRLRARSVAAIVERRNLIATAGGSVSIGGRTLEQRYAMAGKVLCQREAFRTQPSAAVGSAFLVAPDIIATAHHCLNAGNLGTRCVVFDFETGADRIAPTTFRTDQMYGLGQYLAGAFDDDGTDWALVRLDRSVNDRSFLQLARNSRPPDLTPLYVIGHPSGLPKKIAGNAEIRDNTPPTHFVANLDTYGGNSGSPVFNALTHEVEGILARGDADFVPLGDCYASLICPLSGCSGEDCVRIAPVAEFLAS
ncbi:serine protease [Pseudorhodoferax sp. Leaf265]|uniref:trypsin-like serine peptidase n=1 Tax=Pseudorhodoferax sp. Leaf265 TaxID=1736315 RepID=UPI0006F2987C|nr:serine protease [Pseudorhodoferax sp. Leaf265]KQP12065.1 hypothetical protein ASF45_32180 [Pseudorhodoferax sp. Leaf265]